MKEWKETTFGDVAAFTSKPRNLDVKAVAQVPFVPMEVVPQDNAYIHSWIWKPGKTIRSGNYFEKGDCLLAKITPCFENGKQGIAQDIPAHFGFASTELIPFHGHTGISNKYFLFYFFLEATTRRQIAQKMEGATGRQRIPLTVLKKWPILLPPLPEQKKIAAILLKLQQAISAQDQIIQSLTDLKKSTMQHLFTYGLRGENTKMTEIGEIPESWDVVPLEEVREFLQYGTSKRCTEKQNGVAVLRIPNVTNGRIDTTKLKYTNVPDSERERFELKNGDVLFVRTNGQKDYVGRTAVYRNAPTPAMFASYLIRARLKEHHIHSDFLQIYTETEQGKAQLSGQASPASDGKFNINTKTINNALLPLPKPAEQNQIITDILTISDKTNHHESQKAALQDLFKTTLNKLMTGEIRIADLDIDVKEVEV